MDLNLIVTVLIAIIPVIYAWLYKKEKRLILVIDKNIYLFKDMASGIEGLSVSYNGSEITENLYLLKAFIFYIGDKDLENVNKNRTYISVPEDCQILDFNVLDKPDGLNVESKIENNKVYIDFDLIKHSEYIYIEALVSMQKEIKANPESFEDLFSLNDTPYTLNHRIGDISKADTLTFENYKKLATIASYVFIFIIFLGFMAYLNIAYMDSEYKYNRVFSNNSKNVSVDSFYTDIYLKKYKVDSLEKIKEKDIYNKIINDATDLVDNKLYLLNGTPKTIEERFGKEIVSIYFDDKYFSYLQKKRQLLLGSYSLAEQLKSKARDSASFKSAVANGLAEKLFTEKVVPNYNVLSFIFKDETENFPINDGLFVKYIFVDKWDVYWFLITTTAIILVYLVLIRLLNNLYKYRHILGKILKFSEKSNQQSGK